MNCVCDGSYIGCDHTRRCGAEVIDRRWGPWCENCNPRRFVHIKANAAEVIERLTKP